MAKDLTFNIPHIPNPAMLAAELQIETQRLSHSDVMYEKIIQQIAVFEKSLKLDEEVGAYLTHFGKEIIIQIESVGYQKPYLIIFNGRDTIDSSRVQLIQHVSQVNLLFVAIKVQENREPIRIGFQIDSRKEESKTAKK